VFLQLALSLLSSIFFDKEETDANRPTAMCSITVIILLTGFAQANAQGGMADHFEQPLITLFTRAQKVLPFQQRDLEYTTLGKPEETTTTPAPKLMDYFKKIPAKMVVTGALEAPAKWPLKAAPKVVSTTEFNPVGIHCTLKSSDSFGDGSTGDRKVVLEKKIKGVCCSLEGPASYPPKGTASIKGTLKNDVANVCYNLKSPTTWPLKQGGTVSLEKKIGSTSLTLKSKVDSLQTLQNPTATMSHKVGDSDKSVCFQLASPAGSWPPKPTATITSSLETAAGTIAATLESQASSWPPKPTGKVSLKKKLGPVGCCVESNSDGNVHCTFMTSMSAKGDNY